MALHKWDFIRGIREEQYAIAYEKKRHRMRMSNWARYTSSFFKVKEVFGKFQEKLAELALHKKKCQTIDRISKAHQRWISRSGPKINERGRKVIRNSLMLAAPIKIE